MTYTNKIPHWPTFLFLFFLFLAAVIHSMYCLLLPIEHHSRWRLRVGGTFAMAIPKLLIQFRLPVDASITIKRGPWSEFILYLWHIEMKPSHSHLYPRIDSAEKITSANRQDNGKIACRRAGRVGAWVERVSYVSTISTISSQIVKPKMRRWLMNSTMSSIFMLQLLLTWRRRFFRIVRLPIARCIALNGPFIIMASAKRKQRDSLHAALIRKLS